MSPEEINQHISDLMNDSGGNIRDHASAVRAEEARLSQRSRQLSREAEANPNNLEAQKAADDAFKDVTDFMNGPVAKLKQNFHQAGVGLQGELPIDLGTFNGLREAWLKDTGKMPPASVEPKMREMAKKVTNGEKELSDSMQKLGNEIDRVTKGRKLPTEDDVVKSIMDTMKVEPCLT